VTDNDPPTHQTTDNFKFKKVRRGASTACEDC
jgi:hypothetical protein